MTKLTRREVLALGGGIVLARAASGLTQDVRTRAMERAASRRDEMVSLLSELVAIPSPVGSDAGDAQEVVARYLSGLGYSVDVTTDDPMEYADDPEFMSPGEDSGPAVNVIARPDNSGSAPRLALFAHIDTERAGEGWETDPFTPAFDGNRMVGLGTADDKGGIAAMLAAASILTEARGPAPTVMSLHGKGGGSRGSLPAFRRAFDLDAVLYLHPSETGRGLADIKNEVLGALDLVLTARGWRGTPNEIGSPDSARFDEGGDALDACLLAIDSFRQGILRDTEVNVGRLEAGDRVGSVPDRCHAEIRVLFEEPHTTDELLTALKSQLDGLSASLATERGRFAFELEVGRLKTNPAKVSWDARSTVALRRAITLVTGEAPTSYTRHYAGDIRYPIRIADANAYGIGSLGGNFYGPNEWVDIEDLVNLVAVTLLTLEDWAAL
jgi:acetylornithine deacetylase